jgi:hypothetical protein
VNSDDRPAVDVPHRRDAAAFMLPGFEARHVQGEEAQLADMNQALQQEVNIRGWPLHGPASPRRQATPEPAQGPEPGEAHGAPVEWRMDGPALSDSSAGLGDEAPMQQEEVDSGLMAGGRLARNPLAAIPGDMGARQMHQGPLPAMPRSYSPPRGHQQQGGPAYQMQDRPAYQLQGVPAAQQGYVRGFEPPPPAAAPAAGAYMAGADMGALPPPRAAMIALAPPTGMSAAVRRASQLSQLPPPKIVLVERVIDQLLLHERSMSDWGRQMLLTLAESLVPQSMPAFRVMAAASSAYHASQGGPDGAGPAPWPYHQPPPRAAAPPGAATSTKRATGSGL